MISRHYSVVARRGIQAVQLCHANRVDVTDLVGGRLHQHGSIDKSSGSLMGYSFTVELRNGTTMREGQWLVMSAEGAVAVMDDDTFRSWFDTVALEDALEGRKL